MNKWLERSLFINIILVLVFLFLDYVTWNPIADKLNNSYTTRGQYHNTIGSFFNMLTFQLRQSGLFGSEVQSEFTQSWNFPLFVFILAIVINIVIVWRSGKEARKEQKAEVQ